MWENPRESFYSSEQPDWWWDTVGWQFCQSPIRNLSQVWNPPLLLSNLLFQFDWIIHSKTRDASKREVWVAVCSFKKSVFNFPSTFLLLIYPHLLFPQEELEPITSSLSLCPRLSIRICHSSSTVGFDLNLTTNFTEHRHSFKVKKKKIYTFYM